MKIPNIKLFHINKIEDSNPYKNRIKNLLLTVKYPLNGNEIKFLNNITKHATKEEFDFFESNFLYFEKFRFKSYKIIDYFFLYYIIEADNIDNVIKRMLYLKERYEQVLEKIEQDNFERLEHAKNLVKKRKYFALFGGASGFLFKNSFFIVKDIDIIDLSDKYFSVVYPTGRFTVDIFGKNHFFFKNLRNIAVSNYNGIRILDIHSEYNLKKRDFFPYSRKYFLRLADMEMILKITDKTFLADLDDNYGFYREVNERYGTDIEFMNLDREYIEDFINNENEKIVKDILSKIDKFKSGFVFFWFLKKTKDIYKALEMSEAFEKIVNEHNNHFIRPGRIAIFAQIAEELENETDYYKFFKDKLNLFLTKNFENFHYRIIKY